MKENQNIEWKPSWRDEYLKWICGFANANGGKLYIGVDDNGTIIGIPDASKLLEDIPNKVRDLLGIIPDINLISKDNNEAIEIIVEPSFSPISYKGSYHYRTGSTKQELKGGALTDFILKKLGKHWDGVPLPNLQIDQLDHSSIDYFKKKALKGKRIDADSLGKNNKVLLNKLNLTEGEDLKRAAALLFHDNPEKFITGSYIKIGFFRTDTDLLYQDEIHGPLIQQIDKTIEILTTKYLRAMISYEGIQRVERYPYPESALREAITNAVTHKNYSSAVPIQIKVYENKIVIWNDAILPENWTVEILKSEHPSRPYNPDIANTMFRAGFIEAWGRGTVEIINDCLEHGMSEPEYNLMSGGFKITFHAADQEGMLKSGSEKSSEKGSEKSSEKMSGKTSGKTSVKIMTLLEHNNQLTITELAKEIGLSTRAIEKNLKKLQESGQLERVGSDRAGYWKIIEGKK